MALKHWAVAQGAPSMEAFGVGLLTHSIIAIERAVLEQAKARTAPPKPPAGAVHLSANPDEAAAQIREFLAKKG